MSVATPLPLGQLALFAVLGSLKGALEAWAARHQNRGGAESSQAISVIFIVVGLLCPVAIVVELVYLRHALPIAVCLLCAAAELGLMAARVSAIRSLGRFYSVHVRIAADHELVRTGLYRFVRHPLYLVSLLEAPIYPLASGAWATALLMTALEVPTTLWRWRHEEGRLRREFGAAHDEYRRETWL